MKRLALLVLLIASAGSLPAQSGGLRLEDVLQSVTDQYPPLLAALRDRVIADGDLTIAEGKFDLNVKGGFEGDYLTYYRNDLYRLGVEQPLEFQGMSLQGGYGLGRGSFATYDGKLQTDSAGEYKMGLKMPLLRDRGIDARRADLRKAWLGRRIADLGWLNSAWPSFNWPPGATTIGLPSASAIASRARSCSPPNSATNN